MALAQLLKRLLTMLPVLWVMVSLIFLLSRMLPGAYGEQQMLLADESFYGKGSQQVRAEAYNQLLQRTNQHLPLFYFSLQPLNATAAHTYSYLTPDIKWHGIQNQYHRWAAELLRGNMGNSFATNKPVFTLIADAAGNTFMLLLASMLITVALTVLISIQLVKQSWRHWRRVTLAALMILDSLPLFVLSLLLLLLFANPDMLQLFPVFGLSVGMSGLESIVHSLPYMVLPVVCLVLAHLPYLTNQLYTALNETLQTSYIRTARAKGLSETIVIRKHALRNALLPTITSVSELLPVLVAGTIIIETIFAIPGVGRLLVTSVLARDFPVIVGIVVITALVKMLSHVLADVLYALSDPRIKQKGS